MAFPHGFAEGPAERDNQFSFICCSVVEVYLNHLKVFLLVTVNSYCRNMTARLLKTTREADKPQFMLILLSILDPLRNMATVSLGNAQQFLCRKSNIQAVLPAE